MNITRRAIRRHEGSEGPRHDPYSFTEFSVYLNDRKPLTIHSGLSVWARYGKKQTADPQVMKKWAASFGYDSPQQIEDIFMLAEQRRQSKCTCGSRKLEWVSGYPGEEWLQCTKCGNILDSHFNESEVM